VYTPWIAEEDEQLLPDFLTIGPDGSLATSFGRWVLTAEKSLRTACPAALPTIK
jgi:hypothetical protein